MTNEDISKKFFNVPANVSAAVRLSADAMKYRNSKSEFVKAFIKNNGFPVWDKAIVTVHQMPSTSASFTGSANLNSRDSIIIIPIVPEGARYVSGFVTVKLNIDTTINFYRGADYSSYSLNDVPPDSINADKAAQQIMYLNYKVFGYTRFEVSDNRLMSHDAVIDTTKPHRVFVIKNIQGLPVSNVASNESNLLIQQEMCTEIYVYAPLNYCLGTATRATTTTENFDNSHCLIYSGVECYTIWMDDGGGDGGPSGPSGDPGGGEGGGTGSFPCASSQAKHIGIANPCGPNNDPPPVIPIIPQDPCDPLIIALQNDQNFIAKFQSLKTPSVLNDTVEHGFIINNRLSNDYTSKVGTSKLSPTITWELLLGNTLDGKLHDHFEGLNSIFSMQDLVSMAEVYLNNLQSDENNYFEGMVSSYGTPYIVKVNDPQKFRQWITLLQNKNAKQLNDYIDDNDQTINDRNNTLLNEENFLLLLKNKLKGSITLYRGNSDCNQWTELKLGGYNISTGRYTVSENNCD